MQENFDQIRPMMDGAHLLMQLDNLQAWTESTFERHRELIARRRDSGMVRECHGDLHLANITRFEDAVTVFDCIEFNEPFRWIDVINDLAFLLMDLESRGESALANQVLNTYLEYRDDFEALPLLPLYKAYRAMVRAKIALFTMGNPGLTDAEKADLMQRYRAYAQLAEDYGTIPNHYLLATTGLSASGKTCVSAAMANELGLIRLRSDVERKRLHGLAPLDSSRSPTGGNLYTEEATEKTYQRLAELASHVLAAGFPVIVDAASLKQKERALLASIAEDQGVPFALIHCEAPEDLRREWIRNRKGDASEATEELLDAQQTWFEPLTAEEKRATPSTFTLTRSMWQRRWPTGSANIWVSPAARPTKNNNWLPLASARFDMDDKSEHEVHQISHPLYDILRSEDMQAFNAEKAKLAELPSFAHGDFRGLDLRGMDAKGLDFRHAYFRGADLRGVDFSKSRMEGSSIASAKISGCYFPHRLDADEIVMSLNHGTRMRYTILPK